MPSLVTDPDTGEPIWDYDLAVKKPAAKATQRSAKKASPGNSPEQKDEE